MSHLYPPCAQPELPIGKIAFFNRIAPYNGLRYLKVVLIYDFFGSFKFYTTLILKRN